MRREIHPCVYILASKRNGTIYTGVTSNLLQRVAQHRDGLIGGFTKQHGIKRLVWFEPHQTMESAILREKRVKNWNRQWRVELIEKNNLCWRDLAENFWIRAFRSDWAPTCAGVTKLAVLPLRHPRESGAPVSPSPPTSRCVSRLGHHGNLYLLSQRA